MVQREIEILPRNIPENRDMFRVVVCVLVVGRCWLFVLNTSQARRQLSANYLKYPLCLLGIRSVIKS